MLSPDGEASAEGIDLDRLRQGRLARLRDKLKARDLCACVLVDPVNIRFATGARNMEVFHRRNPARYLFVPAEGPVILFEFTGCQHLARGPRDHRRDPPRDHGFLRGLGPARG